MDAINSVQEFKQFIKLNHEKIYANAIDANDISEDDEWIKDKIWDDIYKQEAKQYGKL